MREFVQSLPLLAFLTMLAFVLAMAGVAAFAGIRARRRAALVKATPTSPIGMAEDGYREFEGTAQAIDGPPVAAPLTGSPCCWYHARVERYVSASRRASEVSGWTTVRDATSGTPFLVRDATGACVVQPLGAEVTARDRSVWFGAAEDPSDRNPERHLMTSLPTTHFEVAGGPDSRYRYTEERIYAGDPLLVLGEFRSGRFDRSINDEDVDDDAEEIEAGGPVGDDAGEEDGGSTGGKINPWSDLELADELTDRARATTRATIARGAGERPFIVSATPQASHVGLSELGGSAALNVALVPLAIAALLLYARFG